MKRTGKWVPVVENIDDKYVTVRMLHKDRRGRDCVRYKKQWRLVERQRGEIGYRYVTAGIA